jgi:hypothetical protein
LSPGHPITPSSRHPITVWNAAKPFQEWLQHGAARFAVGRLHGPESILQDGEGSFDLEGALAAGKMALEQIHSLAG